MTGKLQTITELVKTAASDMTSDAINWKQFLVTAAWNYRYKFQEQVLIHAQRQGARACASIEVWNSLGRWVNRGAKGIALVDDSSAALKLRYVFDVSDTNSRKGTTLDLWEMQEQYRGFVIEALENSFGDLIGKDSFGIAIMATVHNVVEDNFPDYVSNLMDVQGNSLFADNDERSLQETLKTILKNSIAYMVLTRCGIDADTCFGSAAFIPVSNFNTPETIGIMGDAVSDIAGKIIREIYKTIKNTRETEKFQIHTIDTKDQTSYHDITDETKSERMSEDDESNIHQTRGLSDTGPDSSGSDADREIREDAQEIPQNLQERDLLGADDFRETYGSSDGDRQHSEGAGGADSYAAGQITGIVRGIETDRPDEVGGDDEQYQAPGGDDSPEGTDTQLEYFDREAEDRSLPFLHSDVLVKELLKTTPHLKANYQEISDYFNAHDQKSDQTEFIKSIFNNEETVVSILGGKQIGYKTYQNVLHLWEGTHHIRMSQGFYDWSVIVQYFLGMVLLRELPGMAPNLTTVNKQMELIDRAEAQAHSPFSFFNQETIDYALQRGSGMADGKYRIYEQFSKRQTSAQNERFLTKEYGVGGACPVISGTGISEHHDGKGISLSKDDEKLLLSWAKVSKRIGELIAADRYLNAKEKEHYPRFLMETQQQRIKNEEELIARGILSAAPMGRSEEDEFWDNQYEDDELASILGGDSINAQTDETKREDTEYEANTDPHDETKQQDRFGAEYRYHLGDKVFLGACEYEVFSFDDDVVILFDLDIPLFTTEMKRSVFDRQIRESGCNEHLRIQKDLDKSELVAKATDAALDKLGNEPSVSENTKASPAAIISDAEQESETESEAEQTPGSDQDNVDSLIGRSLKIDSRDFELDSIDAENDRVSLRDITFQQSAGFPIFRSEPLELVKELLSQKQEPEPDITPLWEKPKLKSRAESFDIHPEVPLSMRSNYALDNETDFDGIAPARTGFAAKERLAQNIEAIKLLKTLETENRFATSTEQETLAKYVGFGGMPQAFDENNNAWAGECSQLKSVLDENEYSSARESTLTAFYTPPVVIKAMYEAIANMGFKTGNILEPSCGTGNFFGLLPDSMQSCKMYGVELDSITGRIARQLYQKASIAVQGFEKTTLPDSFFDLAIGNVPFGQFKLADKCYDRNKFLIHDYFFAKTLDKVRPGGVIAFITSKGTMDKENPSVRRYMAQRADLLGAIRLPDNAFKAGAGTTVTSDIIFLQKRDRIIDAEPDWVHLGKNENGISMNNYFLENPDMVMGEMVMESTQYGMDSTCRAYKDTELETQLQGAIANIHAEVTEYEVEQQSADEDMSIPADPSVRNFSFAIVDGKLYFRENSRMSPVNETLTAENRIRGMIEIRDCVRTLIDYQTKDYPDSDIAGEQQRLNSLYDSFVKKYGAINSRANNTVFSEDSSYCLLCSLEILDENSELSGKADMFTKRTIKRHSNITKVDTASESLAVAIGEKGFVDMAFMSSLTGKPQADIENELYGVIFRNPAKSMDSEPHYETADEYLSGNVREKLFLAKRFAKTEPSLYAANIKALETVQPKDLNASEISIRLGATWIPPEIIRKFIFELLGTQRYKMWDLKVHYSKLTSEWNIEGKSSDKTNVKANSTYGTVRINAYKIIEDTLNLKDVRIYDYHEMPDGKRKQELNKEETAVAQQKQELIKSEFADWVWMDPERRELLCKIYNEKFNSQRTREYDGQHIHFGGMNPEISLRQHQVNAVARILYGGNTLLAHVVGAGKTFEMVAAAMESKRLGLCHKSLLVVPNHLTEQWSAEFLQLYPSANILVATRKDFETRNRKKFCGRIATGDYDAIIIGHSQFERIPMSIERQQSILRQQINEISCGITELKQNRGERFSIKQLEKTKKSIGLKLEKLNDQSRKDDVVTFEELGVDRLFIDEAHYYKNLFLFTKMRNVGGIAQTEAQKSSDLFMKCRYMDELTGGRGIIFATGTPISNSMAELYTMQRYLQYNTLKEQGLQHFDSWASTFGETVTTIELAPEGTGYRAKTRFAMFYNIPELMTMFKEVADIQTADKINLPIPKALYRIVALKPSEQQKNMVEGLALDADRVRKGQVDPSILNMLLITHIGKMLATDQRLVNPLLSDHETSKVRVCADNIFEIWARTMADSLTQLVFCDLSTPHYDGTFNVYDDIKTKLKAKGIPENEIAFIHDAKTEIQKKELFGKVRTGQIRVLIGSTAKMGSGTNVQQKLIALHDLDCPWRPSDLEQRSGRILRQGNPNPEVEIFRYVTENTFDAYLYQLVESKQRFISQIMTSKSPVRSAQDLDETSLSYAEIKALATGNPFIKEKMDLDISVARLKLLKANHLSQRYSLEDRIIGEFPRQIKSTQERIEGYKADMKCLAEYTSPDADGFSPMVVGGTTYTVKAEAGKAILEECSKMTCPDPVIIGDYRGFSMELLFDCFAREYKITLKNELSHVIPIGTDTFGNITRLDNLLEGFEIKLQVCEEMLSDTITQLTSAKVEIEKPFAKEGELKTKSARLDELNILLNMDKKENEIVAGEPEEEMEEDLEPKNRNYER